MAVAAASPGYVAGEVAPAGGAGPPEAQRYPAGQGLALAGQQRRVRADHDDHRAGPAGGEPVGVLHRVVRPQLPPHRDAADHEFAIAVGMPAVGYACYYAYLHPRRADRWTMPDPVREEDRSPVGLG